MPLLEYLIICKSLYLDKLAWSIEAMNLFMCIHLVPITWARDLVSLIPWNLALHQRHFHWLFSSLSMQSYYHMDETEMRTSILPTYDGFWLKRWWYFEGELPGGSTMSKYCLINDEQNYWEIKFGEGYLSITNKY